MLEKMIFHATHLILLKHYYYRMLNVILFEKFMFQS